MEATIKFLEDPRMIKHQCSLLIHANFIHTPMEAEFNKVHGPAERWSRACSQPQQPQQQPQPRRAQAATEQQRDNGFLITSALKRFRMLIVSSLRRISFHGANSSATVLSPVSQDNFNRESQFSNKSRDSSSWQEEESSRAAAAATSHENALGAPDESKLWDCKGFLRLSKAIKYYRIFSSAWLCYVVLKYLLITHFSETFNCLLIGRLVYAERLSLPTSCLFAIYNLSWRAYQTLYKRPMYLNMLHFLLQTESDINRFHRKILPRQNNWSLANQLSALRGAPRAAAAAAATTTTTCTQATTPTTRAASVSSDGAYMQEAEWQGSGASNQQLSATLRAKMLNKLFDTTSGQELALASKPSAREDYFRRIICYQVFQRAHIVYCIRPNRTRQSYAELRHKLASTTCAMLVLFSWLVMFVSSAVVYSLFWDYRNALEYSGCEPELAARFQRNELRSVYTFTLSPYRLCTLTADTIENWVLWFDSGLALTCNYALLYLLNCDLLLYWRHLQQRVEHLRTSRARSMARQQWRTPTSRLEALELECELRKWAGLALSGEQLGELERLRAACAAPQFPSRPKPASTMPIKPNLSGRSQSTRAGGGDDDDEVGQDERIHFVQSEIKDFFKLIDSYDAFISDVLTNAITIWLVTFALSSYNALSRNKRHLPLQVHLLQVYHLACVLFASLFVLGLHRSCLRTYQSICSLMALDQSKHKQSFLNLLEFFTKRKRTMYTLFHQYPYAPTTFLSIIGWTFSCFFIMDSLFRHGSAGPL